MKKFLIFVQICTLVHITFTKSIVSQTHITEASFNHDVTSFGKKGYLRNRRAFNEDQLTKTLAPSTQDLVENSKEDNISSVSMGERDEVVYVLIAVVVLGGIVLLTLFVANLVSTHCLSNVSS